MNQFISKITERLAGRRLIVASSSEPYVHYLEEEEIKWRRGTGGVVTALDPVLAATGGTWVAQSSGDADRQACDEKGYVKVPPESGAYTLKRIFVSKKDAAACGNAANGALWPLSHIVYVRPRFVDEEWEAFRQVNRRFAEAIAEEAKKGESVVWLNDYQLVLCAKYVKELVPDVPTVYFWHIPWPNPQVFKICPWHVEIMDAVLSNDIIGFHTRYHSVNFLDSVDQTIEARVDRPASSVHYKGREVTVRALPISVDFDGISAAAENVGEGAIRRAKRRYGIGKGALVVGIDRMDYTKGLAEKIKAIDEFLQKHPESAEKITLVQIASPTRTHLEAYRQTAEEVETLVEEVNWRNSTDSWKPIIFENRYASTEEIYTLYGLADVCIITPLHDGMNLVSKEFVAAKNDGNGVLILSKFAGSNAELKDALSVNPFSTNEVVAALETALQMPIEERRERMTRLRAEVGENNVFKWASDFLSMAAKVRG
ncbi:MAG: trehalose-6-phosphate synthase [Candidatus Micrarchaeota archaeon]